MTQSRRLRWLLLILIMQVALYVCVKSSADLQLLRPSSILTVLKKKIHPEKPREVYAPVETFYFDNKDSLKQWEEKIFKGKSSYEILTENGENYLKSASRSASSGLYKRLSRKTTPDLTLRWQWRALVFPKKKEPSKLANRREDDFAARIYVVFPGSNFFNSNVIEYIWDETLPKDTYCSSPYSDRIKLFVIESGVAADKKIWREEVRNIYEDYEKLFGKPPDRSIGAIALMSDSDNTDTESEADFKSIAFVTKKTKT